MNFERRFAEIWHFTPFSPSHRVNEFLSRFTVDGVFNAERFWEYVAVNQGKKRPTRRAPNQAKQTETEGRLALGDAAHRTIPLVLVPK